ncbi:15069_t:CDS:2, partial [Acaulospora morrowiae]
KSKSIVYGLLLPLIVESSKIGIQSSRGIPQLEVITRTIDELDDDSIVALLIELFSDSRTSASAIFLPFPLTLQSPSPPLPQHLTQWDDSMIEIVFTLINQNFQIEPSHTSTSNQSQSIFSKLLFYLSSNIERLPKHPKLCQILMLLVTKHADSVMDKLEEIREIAEKSKAFIRKGVIGRVSISRIVFCLIATTSMTLTWDNCIAHRLTINHATSRVRVTDDHLLNPVIEINLQHFTHYLIVIFLGISRTENLAWRNFVYL